MPAARLPSAERDTLLVIDVQDKLFPLIADAGRLAPTLGFVLDAAKLFGVTVRATEQYPKGLGPTIAELRPKLPATIPAKTAFSAAAGFLPRTSSAERVILAGIETHVCVLQTALELVHAGYEVAVVTDAVGSRHRSDHDAALRRMEAAGVVPVTAEMIGFEWCGRSDRPEFKDFSRLVLGRDEQLRGTVS